MFEVAVNAGARRAKAAEVLGCSLRQLRGVGLSAVRELCRSFHGDAHLLANDQGQGSLVRTFAGSKEQLKKSA